MTSAPPTEPQLDVEERGLLERGVREFNEGYFFESHDTLEDLWAGVRGPSRDFFQGLIQVTVAFYHLGNGNRRGARSLFERALRRFTNYPDRYYGFDVAGHRAEIRRWSERTSGEGPVPRSLEEIPKWHFEASR